ncbi:hypothetical protein [Methylobacterium oryzihabitans]|uniref:Uncharacterized protein n=1 Tax=Methylobacterium oryzihabitans TaxID=2499852 RepID=A0A3S2YS04_9HYPH|nr:hypothetical protein [Methylobacterium oryzihabitans]RVU18149.1 hypothetical protein EOE48_12245 [Methylobacterium oryzihabitans]
MTKFTIATVLALAAVLPGVALADGGGGGRMPAGGAHMSSYVHHPYHDPRSTYWQGRGTGQILGSPMKADPAGRLQAPGTSNWAVNPGRR